MACRPIRRWPAGSIGFNPIQNRIGGGCHLIRDTMQLVTGSACICGDASTITCGRVPRFAGYMTEGLRLKS